ncbi:hemin-degrading factor [Pseudoduganella violacea]|uniref:Putative hemin transport protein n=1 Tax=Pseudoduganella violacea TaxID=1715466 RepID=A0A7W5B6W9_9BURK|nr:ChuX/HutX family heme-like substrate-binding protein [Pseudoduganella violacea]MBB3117646.1 putative hemin transport protein [Pseudoduganella violacea]
MKTKHRYALALAASMLLSAACVSAAPALGERWATLKAEQPKLQIRDAARALNVSEAELLATGIGKTATRLSDSEHAASDIMRRALDLGTVMALTRNENAVLERTGVAMRVKQEAPTGDKEKDKESEARLRSVAGGYLGGDIDLRFHFANWKHAFAVVQPGRDGAITRSLQFFDAQGNAAHKVYLKNEAGIAAFDKIVADFRHPQQTGELKIAGAAPKAAEKADSAVDVKEFQLAWQEMTDVHQFNRIVREFGLTREQAMRLAPAGVVQRISPQAMRKLLDDSAKQQLSIMAFLGNDAVTQIFSGKIEKTAASGEWYNVLDPNFNLHVRESALKTGYIVQRAGVTSVEFFDKDGELVVTFFGVRERAKPQPQSWVDLTRSLPKA